jgi:hypothetical protein
MTKFLPCWSALAASMLLGALAATLSGCESTPVAPAPATAAQPGGTAAQAHARIVEAYNQCNAAAFVGGYASLFSFSSSNTKVPLNTRDELQRYLVAGCATRPNPTMALVHQTSRVSGAVTILAGQYRFKVPVPAPTQATQGTPATAGAAAGAAPVQLVDVLQNFTLVLERGNDRWLALAHHISVAP